MSKAKSSLGLKDGRWIVEVKEGKIVHKANIDNKSELCMVLNDSETFTGLGGCSLWKVKDPNLETEDLEQIFKGNEDEVAEVQPIFRF